MSYQNYEDMRLRLTSLEAEVTALRAQVVSHGRPANLVQPKQVRTGFTVADPDTGVYAVPGVDRIPNLYTVELSDDEFTTTLGTQGRNYVSSEPRGTRVIACNRVGGYIPEGEPVTIARIPGRRTSYVGEWFVVAGQMMTFVAQSTSSGGQGFIEYTLRDGSVIVDPDTSGDPKVAVLTTSGKTAPTSGLRGLITWIGNPDYTAAFPGDWYWI